MFVYVSSLDVPAPETMWAGGRVGPNLVQNWFKMCPNLIQHWSRIGPNLAQHWPNYRAIQWRTPRRGPARTSPLLRLALRPAAAGMDRHLRRTPAGEGQRQSAFPEQLALAHRYEVDGLRALCISRMADNLSKSERGQQKQ